MTRLETIIKEVVPDGTTPFDCRKTNDKHAADGLSIGDNCFIISRKYPQKAPLLIDTTVIDRVSDCSVCTLREYECRGIDCNLKVNKIYRI